jgi:hypothetical protein
MKVEIHLSVGVLSGIVSRQRLIYVLNFRDRAQFLEYLALPVFNLKHNNLHGICITESVLSGYV